MDPSRAYREAAVRGATSVRLVTLLYEQAIEDLRRALTAHARGDIEGRTREISHAMLVLGHLQATLDQERGGQVATNLEKFYIQVRAALLEAQCRQSTKTIEQQISHLMLVRDAWEQVERANTAALAPLAPSSTPEPSLHSTTDWKA